MRYVEEIEKRLPISCEYGYFLTPALLSIYDRQRTLWDLDCDETAVYRIREVLYDYYFDLMIMKKPVLICRKNLRYKMKKWGNKC